MNTHDLFKAALIVAGKRELRFYLNGVHVSRSVNTADVKIEATDGHIMMQAIIRNDDERFKVAENTDVVLNRAQIETMLKSFNRGIGMITTIDNTGAVFEQAGQSLTVAPIPESHYPDVMRVINQCDDKKKTIETVGFDASLMGQVCKCIELLRKEFARKSALLDLYDATTQCKWSVTMGENESAILLLMPVRL